MSAKKKREKATPEEIKLALPIPALHTRCPYCGFDMPVGAWGAAHLHLDLTATCQGCQKKYHVEGGSFDQVDEDCGVLGEEMDQGDSE